MNGRSHVESVGLKMLSGALAGLFEVCIALPLDMTKTRLQIQTTGPGDPGHFHGVFDCLYKTFKNEGVPSLWKGFLPSILIKVPKMATKFLLFEEYTRLLSVVASLQSPALLNSLSGVGVGATEALLFNPLEVIKVTLQTDLELAERAPSGWAVAKRIFHEHGFGTRGLYKGLTASICSNVCFNFVFLGVFYTANQLIEFKERSKVLTSKIIIGLVGSSMGCVSNLPFDVAKTRIQGPQPKGQVKYRRVFKTVATIYHEEGFSALYKGLGPKVIRVGPCGTVMILLYDYMNQVMHV